MNYDPNQWQSQQPPPPPPQWTTQPGQWQQTQHNQPTQWQAVPNLPPPDPRLTQPPRQPKNQQAVAWLIILAVLLVGGICSAAMHASTTPQTASVATTPTQATTPTSQPTTKPTPRPTTKPTSKPAVVVQPTSKPAAAPPPAPKPTQPPAGPTYNFNSSGGQMVYDPPADFCTTHRCVTTFWKDTSGYVVECGNGEYSHSGGVSGACSRDGKVAATLYQHG